MGKKLFGQTLLGELQSYGKMNCDDAASTFVQKLSWRFWSVLWHLHVLLGKKIRSESDEGLIKELLSSIYEVESALLSKIFC